MLLIWQRIYLRLRTFDDKKRWEEMEKTEREARHERTRVTKRARTILCVKRTMSSNGAISVTFYIRQCRSPLYVVCTIFGAHGNLIQRLLFADNSRKHIKLIWFSELRNNYAQLNNSWVLQTKFDKTALSLVCHSGTFIQEPTTVNNVSEIIDIFAIV